MLRRQIGWSDLALGGGFAAFVAVTAVTGGRPLVVTGGLAASAAALVLRRLAPLAPALVYLAVMVTLLSMGHVSDEIVVLAIWMCGAYAVAAYAPTGIAVLGLGLWLANMVVPTLATAPDNVWFGATLLLAAWSPGLLVRRSRAASDEARSRATQIERSSAAMATAAVEAERARIARELHDVVAHAVSIIVVQAAAAEQTLPSDPAAARRALGVIQDAGRQAVADLALMLDLLRDPAPQPSQTRASRPSLTGLDALLAGTEGVTVELVLDGDLSGLPPAVDLSAYRVVQEALTNALKHAPGSRVCVRVRRVVDAVEVEVVDEDGRSPEDRLPGNGHGLPGLHERVQVFGGRFEAGPTPAGGFRVYAALPLELT